MFLERFWSHVRIHESGCWLWTGFLSPNGYGNVTMRQGLTHEGAHRMSWQLHTREPIPEGLQIDHLCRNRACVNPQHLEVVTIKQNLLRGNTRAASNASKTHCLNGHEFDRNYKNRKGRTRFCLTCHNARQRERRRNARDKGRDDQSSMALG